MSDLQCAATLLLCCAGEAEYDGGAASLTLAGRNRARELGQSLRSTRVAMVYSSSLPPAVQTAELAAVAGGAVVRVRDGLREAADGESPEQVRARVTEELQGIVDLHRGETVLVVSHSGAVRSAVPQLAGNLPDDYGAAHEPAPCAVTEVAVDGDGWLVRSWAGQPV